MIDYEPYRDGNNPNHKPLGDSQTLSYLKQGPLRDQVRETEFRSRILQWLKDHVICLHPGPVVVAIAPGHEKNSNPTGFMHEIVKNLLPSVHISRGKVVGVECCKLIRTKTVLKQSETRGVRSMATHRESKVALLTTVKRWF
jgi:hypothetical protein